MWITISAACRHLDEILGKSPRYINIIKVLQKRKKYKTAYKYKWEYATETEYKDFLMGNSFFKN